MELFREGTPADSWWVLVDGHGRSRAPGRPRGAGRDAHHGPSRAVGRRLPGVGPDQQLPRHRTRRQRRPDVPGALGRARRADAGLVPVRRAPDRRLLPDRPHDGLAVAPARGADRARARWPPGLAHELNNPASASARAVDALQETCDTLLASLAAPGGELAQPPSSSSPSTGCAATSTARRSPSSPLAIADREEAISDWLEARDVVNAWRIAPPLAAAGVDVDWCVAVATILSPPTPSNPGSTGWPARSPPGRCCRR